MSSLIKQCQKLITQLEKDRKEVFTYSGANVEIMNDATRLSQSGGFPFETHLNLEKLKFYLSTGEASDVNIYIAGYGLVARAHKLILSLRSPPFAKVILHFRVFFIFGCYCTKYMVPVTQLYSTPIECQPRLQKGVFAIRPLF